MVRTKRDRTFSARALDWFFKHQRPMPWRETRDPYRIWLSEVMLQQTPVKTVIPYYNRFIEQYPHPGSLASAREDDVLKLWEGLGYYQRCHHFLQAVQDVSARYGGTVPDDPELFKRLPGVGDYTAAAVMSIAYGHVLPVVDGNVIRVMTRYFQINQETGKAGTKKSVLEHMKLLMPADAPGDFNQAMMELGALICTPKNPRCAECPLADSCGAYITRQTGLYPYTREKTKIPEYQVGLGLILKKGNFLIQKRPSSGHLAGMWELPGGKTKEDESPEEALKRKCRDELALSVLICEQIAVAGHAYSHFKIHVSLYSCDAGNGKEKTVKDQPVAWIRPNEVHKYPFPSVNHKLFARVFLSDKSLSLCSGNR